MEGLLQRAPGRGSVGAQRCRGTQSQHKASTPELGEPGGPSLIWLQSSSNLETPLENQPLKALDRLLLTTVSNMQIILSYFIIIYIPCLDSRLC